MKNKRYFDFIGNRNKFFILSAILIAAILVCTLVFGVQMDIQFKGGTIITYSYEGDINTDTVKREVESTLKAGVTVRVAEDLASNSKTFIINLVDNKEVDTDTVSALTEAMQKEFPELNFKQVSLSTVNPSMGREFLLKSVVAVVFAFLCLVIFIAIRFRNIGGWAAGIMSVIALLHDIIMVFGVFVIFRIPISDNFIAVLLTILGYSINDTIVIYDRIRENEKLYSKKTPFVTLVNDSINQCLRRSVNTTVTTTIALASICVVALIFNVTSILTFAFPLMIGMISGVYSSIFIACPLWVAFKERGKGKKKKVK